MTTVELYTKGTRVWIQHPEKVWEGAELLENYNPSESSLEIRTETLGTKKLPIKSEKDLPPLRNPSILIGENDLTSLSYLHEPAVLHNLQVRFCQQKAIYTYCGIVLVAINPYDDLPIYGTDTIEAYRGQAMGDLDPHIFAVSEEAYTKLEREQRDQSIIVSGESGAGKTVSAKYAMRYFATVGGSTTETQVEKKVLASSPIMEAIGNAKTTRNDNSSRFGKYIEIQFNKYFHIIGASMRTYLLEKSRVVFQAPDERNYHIFYQLCAARESLPYLHLGHQNTFEYLNQGNSPTIDGVNDLATYEETKNALNMLGFTDREQCDMFKILSSVLHLGNIHFLESIIQTENEQDQEGVMIKENDKHLNILGELLEFDVNEMQKWLCTRRIVSMREVFLKAMSVEQAKMSRDALAKHMYAELFRWIVYVVNKSLETGAARHKFIGVLDIYGFETFEVNSFEQFCINYANEKLQQQFNQHVFKLEQEEYIKEEIEWKMIDFYDNQPCIDLIESKLGILDLLDEECRMPKGTDSSWTDKLYAKCVKYKHFSKARFGTTAFLINHFADNVQYESNGFLEKNRDTVIEEQVQVLRMSRNKLVKKLFDENFGQSSTSTSTSKLKVVAAKPATNNIAPKAQHKHKKSVGSQFRDSLNMLMGTLNATTPHYVRCIKPNDSKQPFEYNARRAVQQLRACGVLETIRLSAAGFPSRWTYLEFFQRYRVLCRFADINRDDMRRTCQNILRANIRSPDQYQFGRTKIFFRAGQVAYLEKLRGNKLRRCCVIVQSQIRMFIARARYLRVRRSAQCLQRYGRGLLARRRARHLRHTRAAITLQRYVRGWLQATKYRRLYRRILGIQCYARGYLARLLFIQIKYNSKAIIIQRYVRGWLARQQYRKQKCQIVLCQSVIRRFLARRQFKKLRVEARSIEHVKKLNKGLENKIISLQQRIEELIKENHLFKNIQQEVIELKLKVESFKTLEIEIKKLNILLVDKNKEIANLEEALKNERDEKMDLVEEQDKYRQEAEAQRRYWNEETSKLRKELDNMNEIVKSNQQGAEENLKTRLEQEKLLLINEQDQDRNAYQKLLQEYHSLEQQCESLERQLARQTHTQRGSPGHVRNLSDVSSISEGLATADDYGNSSSSTESNQQQQQQQQQDVGLVLKLQHKLTQVERERNRLRLRLDELEAASPTGETTVATDAYRISELEVDNSSLQRQLRELRASIGDGTDAKQLLGQFAAMQEELERRREEIIQLRGVLATQTANLKTITQANYGRDVDMLNEDGELVLAYETQKKVNKQLELELQDEKNRCRVHERELRIEIDKLREDNERQQKLLSVNLTKTPASQTEAYMQHEITRLTSDNLDLQEKVDTVSEGCRKFKKQAKYLAKKLKDAGLLDGTLESEVIKTEQFTTSTTNSDQHNNYVAIVRKRDGGYLGMFEFQIGDESIIIRNLITDLKPRTAVTLLPGLPAYIMFMCIRHTDYINDENKVRSLLTAFINAIKKVIKKRHEDFETTVLWLANTLRILHNLKQYSGDKAFQASNTPRQNEQCLRNFDLSEYRQVLSDIAVWIYQGIIRILEDKIQPLIIPAILEHEAITGIGGNKPAGMRGRASSVCRDLESPISVKKAPHTLLQELTNSYKILGFYGVDPEVIAQVIKQLFYFVCASSLNNLLLRKDLCHWSKGTQIRYNLSHLEMWTRERRLDEQPILDTLKPIIEAAHLLQARKTDEDVDSVCEMCASLSAQQICKILTLYTPADEFEQRVPTTFIRKVQVKLSERQHQQQQQQQQVQEQKPLLMDIKYNFPVRFPFNPSTICLEDIEIPEVLNLPMLKKI